MRTLFSLGLAFLCLTATPLPAFGQPGDAEDEAAREQALSLFEESREHYEAGRFDVAAALLRRAYDLHAAPALLYNLGRALENSGDSERAARAYEQYLEQAREASEVPEGAPALEVVRARLDALRAELAEEEPRATEPGDERTGETARTLTGPVVTLASGGALLAAGLGLGLAARSRNGEAADGADMATRAELRDEAEGLALGANILFAIGGAAATAGLVWWLVGGDADAEDPSVEAAVGPAGLLVRGRF